MKAIHGGKAKNDRIEAGKLARLLRGGTFPLAYAYPKGMREPPHEGRDRENARRRSTVRNRDQVAAVMSQETIHQVRTRKESPMAFSEALAERIWQRLGWDDLA